MHSYTHSHFNVCLLHTRRRRLKTQWTELSWQKTIRRIRNKHFQFNGDDGGRLMTQQINVHFGLNAMCFVCTNMNGYTSNLIRISLVHQQIKESYLASDKVLNTKILRIELFNIGVK